MFSKITWIPEPTCFTQNISHLNPKPEDPGSSDAKNKQVIRPMLFSTKGQFSREIGIEIIALTFIKQSQEQHVTWMHVIIFIFPNSCVLNITNCKQTGGEGKSPGLLTNSQCQVGREVTGQDSSGLEVTSLVVGAVWCWNIIKIGQTLKHQTN